MSLSPGTRLGPYEIVTSRYFHDFDVSADGQRFLFIRAEPAGRPTRLDAIVNGFPEPTGLAGGK